MKIRGKSFAVSMMFVIAVAGLSGCGVKGGLQPPPTVEQQKAEKQQRKESGESWWERLLP